MFHSKNLLKKIFRMQTFKILEMVERVKDMKEYD